MKTSIKLFLLFFLTAQLHAAKPNIWIHTDMTSATDYNTTSTESTAITEGNSDSDDHVALAQYFLLANKFNTVKIVVGVTNKNPGGNTGTWVKTNFCDNAYAKDYAGMNSRIGGYPSPDSIKNTIVESSLTAGSENKNFSLSPDNLYDNYDNLPATVKMLVDELNNTKYSASNPLYVLVWGGLQEVAMATKHLIFKKNTDALSRLYVVSHWTMSYYHQGTLTDPYSKVANCNTSSAACSYMHNQAKATGAKFKFVDAAATGQHGIVSGSGTFFKGGFTCDNVNEFKKSKLGNLAMVSKFVNDKPDGSDCAAFYTVLGTYGVSLSSFATNGATTSAQEKNAEEAYYANATKIWDDLLVVSKAAAAGAVTTDTKAPTTPTGLTTSSVTQTSLTLSWTASTDNVKVTGYDVYQGTTLKTSVTTNSASITGLSCNTSYSFTVKAKDAAGNKSAASTAKSVTTSACTTSTTTHFEAESYSSMSGITKQTTTDTGGGSNIASIHNNDYADYSFNVAKAGTYTTKFRVSSATNGGTIQVLKGTTVLGSVKVAATGGWQTWTTVTGPSIDLTTTGTQTIRLKFVNTATTDYLFNINWFDFIGSSAVKVARMETEEMDVPSLNISLTPNPAKDFVNLSLDTEASTLLLYSSDNKLLRKIISTSKVNQINVSDLTTGVYLVKVISADKTRTLKFIKN